MVTRILNLLICIDQLAYCLITLGGGYPDETLSSAAYRMEAKGKWTGRLFRPLIDWLLWFDEDHCFKSYMSELKRTQAPLEKITKKKG